MKGKLNFTITSPEIIYLLNCDTLLAELILAVGNIEINLNENFYAKIVSSIIRQQLSSKAADTIWKRVVNLCGDISPESVLSISDELLRAAGTSYAKISYIKEFSQKMINNELDLESLHYLDDCSVLRILTSIKGIGNWTGEMFLIFSLGRLDVFAFDDAGLQRAIKWLYRINTLSKGSLKSISGKWTPYRSIASLYLWKAVDLGLVNKDHKYKINPN